MILDDFKILEDEGGIFCGIFFNGKMIGIIDFVLSGFEGNHCNSYLSLLMISENYRKQGIGKEAVKLVEAEILKNNMNQSNFSRCSD